MKLTYNQLVELIQGMSKEAREMNVTVQCKESDEFLPVENVAFPDTDVLDPGHPVLVISF